MNAIIRVTGLILFIAMPAVGQIARWPTGLVIPGTESIPSGPDAQLDHRDLRYATFDSGLDRVNFAGSDLSLARLSRVTDANFTGAIITGASFGAGFTPSQLQSTAGYQAKNLQGIGLANLDLTGWDFHEQYLASATFRQSTLTNANFSTATVSGANFADTTSRGFTQAQLQSTLSYQSKYLGGIDVSRNNLSGWDFRNQDLTAAKMAGATLTQTNFAGAQVTGVDFTGAVGLTPAQLQSTASYQNKDLRGIGLSIAEPWDFRGQNLAGARLIGNLTKVDLTGASVAEVDFENRITQAQLQSTASYQAKDLHAVRLTGDLTDWNFLEQNLSNAFFGGGTTLDGTRWGGANVTEADFSYSSGFTAIMLQSTGSYQAQDLHGLGLAGYDLTDWNFGRQNLAHANLSNTVLKNANFIDANVNGTNFANSTLTRAQLASTASYQDKRLGDINLTGVNLTNWDLTGQDLTDAKLNDAVLLKVNFQGAKLTNVDLIRANVYDADFRGANLSNADLSTVFTTNNDAAHAPMFSSETVYNQWTRFALDFDPVTAGLTLKPSALGDFDANDQIDQADIDRLMEVIRQADTGALAGSWRTPMFDLDHNALVDLDDLHFLVKEGAHTWIGDTNLDGAFDSSDLMRVFQEGQYEDQIEQNSNWATGDWNADGDFTNTDLIAAFVDGGYEQEAPVRAVATVPEPTTGSCMLLALGMLGAWHRLGQRRCQTPIVSSHRP